MQIARFAKQRYCSTQCRNEGAKGRAFKFNPTPDGGMTFEEIAKEMKCSRGWVQKVYHSALQKLHGEVVQFDER